MDYRRLRLIVLFLSLLVGLLTACRTNANPTGQPVERNPSETVVLPATDQPVTSTPFWEDQAQSLLPAYAADLNELGNLPRYTLQVEINPDAHTFQGRMSLDYTNLEGEALDRLYLRLYPNAGEMYGDGQIKVSELALDGQPLTPRLSQSDSVVEVTLAQDLRPGEQTTLSLDFSGRVPVDFGGEDSAAYGIFNYSQGVLALSGWHPVLAVYDQDGWNLDPVRSVGDAVYSDMAFYLVQVSLPADRVLAASGVEVDKQIVGEQAIIQLVSGPAREFFLAASPDFIASSQQVGEVMLQVYTMGDYPEARQFMLEAAVDSLEIFNQKFGAYPYRELDVVQAPMRNAGGVEYPGIVLIEAGRSLEPQNPVLATTVAHEVAHQWWYHLVGNDVIEEPWLDEALATYSSTLYWEEVYGSQAYQDVLSDFQNRYNRALENDLQGEIDDGIDFYSQPEYARGYGAYVYFKGALFFAALRQEIGDEAFFTALQDYYQSQRYGIASGADLLSVFEEASGRSLEAFYREWLGSAGN